MLWTILSLQDRQTLIDIYEVISQFKSFFHFSWMDECTWICVQSHSLLHENETCNPKIELKLWFIFLIKNSK